MMRLVHPIRPSYPDQISLDRRKRKNYGSFMRRNWAAIVTLTQMSGANTFWKQSNSTRKRKNMSAQPQNPSLYERLGGAFSLATVLDDLIDRALTDARLNANPAVDEAHHKVPPAGFKYHVTEMLCWAAGGPQKYTGRSMRDSHQHLNITPKEWDAFMDDVQQTLDKFKVPAAEQSEVKAIVQSTYSDIVIGKS